jgi:hypothetical protein
MLWWKVAPRLSLILLTAIAYFPTLHAGFIWDDNAYVTHNQQLRTVDGLGIIWFQPGGVPHVQYYPLTLSTFWLEYHLWGLRPAGYHLVNVLLHGLNAVLLAGVLWRLAVPGAWLATALFALHPVHVESVAWITERKNVLSGLFYLLSLGAALHVFLPAAATTQRQRAWGWYLLAVVFFACALLSKTVTCSLPAVLVLLIWWKRGWPTRQDWLLLAPLFALGAGLSLLTVWMEKSVLNAAGEDFRFSALARCLIAGRALWFYAGKLAWPTDLSYIYPRWHIDPSAIWQYAFPLGVLAVGVGLWAARSKLGRGPLVACCFFAGS